MSSRLRIAALLLSLAAIGGGILLLMSPVREALLGLLPPKARIALLAWRHGVTVDHDVRLVMADGVELAATLYLPRDAHERLGTVLVRLPYGRLDYPEGYTAGAFFGGHGYAVLVQDLRGTGESGGELLPWRDAESDGVTTLDWIARQPWSNGKVGTFGCSALGETQLVLARRGHPAQAALIASGAGGAIGSLSGRFGYFGLFEGGVFQLASGFGWFVENGTLQPDAPPATSFDVDATLRTLPLSRMVERVRAAPNGYAKFLATPLGDSRWDEWGYLSDEDRIVPPVFMINTWNDQTVGDALAIAEHVRATTGGTRNRVLIAPGDHCRQSEARPGDRSLEELYLRWFDRWLMDKGRGLDELAPYTWFMLGEDRWHSSDRWPPTEASPERWYLSGSRANTASGDGVLATAPVADESESTFIYDPSDPVPTRGGPACCTADPRTGSGTMDQHDVEVRADVLVYTSQPLAEDLRLAGPIRAVLTVSSDAPDTDLVARLVDVDANGRATNIQEGALRLRYRNGVPAKLLEKGERYSVRVDMRAIAYRVPRGHRLRLDVTSSSFPRLERNLNTGGGYDDTRMRRAANTIHHGQGASYLEIYRLQGAL